MFLMVLMDVNTLYNCMTKIELNNVSLIYQNQINNSFLLMVCNMDIWMEFF